VNELNVYFINISMKHQAIRCQQSGTFCQLDPLIYDNADYCWCMLFLCKCLRKFKTSDTRYREQFFLGEMSNN
ncbi:MAG: hypothetical protein ACYTXC_27010, partial [Nostoc sp.]